MFWITGDNSYCGLIAEISSFIYLCLTCKNNHISFKLVNIGLKSEIKFQDIPEDIRKRLDEYIFDPLFELEVQKAISKYKYDI